jgi:hypothetical protein
MNIVTSEMVVDILKDILKYEKFDTLNIRNSTLKVRQENLVITLEEDYNESKLGSVKSISTYTIKYKLLGQHDNRYSDYEDEDDFDFGYKKSEMSIPSEESDKDKKKITYQDHRRTISSTFIIDEKTYEDIFSTYRNNLETYNKEKDNERLNYLFNMYNDIIDKKINTVIE